MISGKTTSECQQDLARALDIKVKEYEKQRIQQDGSVRHEFTASEALNEKLKRCRSLTAHQISQEHKAHTLESTLEILTGTLRKSQSVQIQKRITDKIRVNKCRKEEPIRLRISAPEPIIFK